LTPTDAIQAAITGSLPSTEIRRAMEAARFPSLRDHASTLVATGIVSRDEVTRVLGNEAGAEPAAAAPVRKSVLIADDEPITRTKVADQVLSLGADDYIMKPFDPAVLTARIKAAFRRRRLAA
jgi:CheY-like chemotaxis protein